MKKYITSALIFCAILFVTPVFAACPMDCDSCDPCKTPCFECHEGLYKTAGIVDLNKARKRSNWVVIKREKQFSKFEKMVRKAGLKKEFDKQNYTVFAPTNAAIESMNQGCYDRLMQKENKTELVRFVMAHTSKGEKSASTICKCGVVVNQNCCRLPVTRCRSNLQVASSSIVVHDIETKNGKIHAINRVLEPYS